MRVVARTGHFLDRNFFSRRQNSIYNHASQDVFAPLHGCRYVENEIYPLENADNDSGKSRLRACLLSKWIQRASRPRVTTFEEISCVRLSWSLLSTDDRNGACEFNYHNHRYMGLTMMTLGDGRSYF